VHTANLWADALTVVRDTSRLRFCTWARCQNEWLIRSRSLILSLPLRSPCQLMGFKPAYSP